MTAPLLSSTIRDRRRAWIWWALALAATAFLIAASFGAVKGQDTFDEQFADMPEGIRALMGIDGEELRISSPAGYLNSQWFANFLPILLSIFGIGAAARVIAGEEGAGRLELLLAHPVRRLRLYGERGAAVLALLVTLAAVTSAVLVAAAPTFDLGGVGMAAMSAASASALLLALVHTSVTFGVGAWTGSRGIAIAAGSVATGGGFLLQSLSAISGTLAPLRWLSPWQWFIDARPIIDGWGPMLAPTAAALAVSAAAVALGAWRFQTRDIGSA